MVSRKKREKKTHIQSQELSDTQVFAQFFFLSKGMTWFIPKCLNNNIIQTLFILFLTHYWTDELVLVIKRYSIFPELDFWNHRTISVWVTVMWHCVFLFFLLLYHLQSLWPWTITKNVPYFLNHATHLN